jgi:hypothetical protein
MPEIMGLGSEGGALDAIAFGVAADLVYNVYSATNSSPQTTELFAGDRSATLWKYVRLGAGQSVILIAIMAYRGRSVWPVIGGGMAGVFMHLMYSHALKAGGGEKPAMVLPWGGS